MIATVTLNPSLDEHVMVHRLVMSAKQRSKVFFAASN